MNKETSEIFNGLKRSLGLIQSTEKAWLLLATAIMLIAGILTNIPALALGKLVDNLTQSPDANFSSAIPFISFIIIVILIREALTVVRKYLVENIATQTEKKQTVATIDYLLKTDLTALGGFQIGSLHGRIFRSIQGLVYMLKLSFLDFLPAFFSAIAAIVIALYQKPFLASIMILVIPTGLFIIFKQISSQKGIRVSLLRGKEKIDGTVVEMLAGIETVRVLNTRIQEVQRVETVAETLRAKEIKHHLFMALFDSTKYLNEGFFYILVISLSILLSTQGIITRGDILVYSILFLSITNPLREIHRILDQAHESSILVNDLYDLQNQPIDPAYNVILREEERRVKGSFQLNSGKTDSSTSLRFGRNDKNNKIETIINIQNLSFSYHQTPILKNISLEIKPGEKIGIAGASGCGKSTLVKLLLRLISGYAGEINILGQDLQTLYRGQIAKSIAYLPQKTYIFSGTIKENILYGHSGNVSEQELIDAAKKANIYTEIINSLGGFEGKITENGNNLSGGQRQRIALARLMLTSPEILIFDEATSALDNTNETIIQKNIEQQFKDKTIIIIAHRLSTLRNCDRILVFDKGEIVQEGTYTKLSKEKGLFQNFLQQREQQT